MADNACALCVAASAEYPDDSSIISTAQAPNPLPILIANELPTALKNPTARIFVFHSPKSTVSASMAKVMLIHAPIPTLEILQQTAIGITSAGTSIINI